MLRKNLFVWIKKQKGSGMKKASLDIVIIVATSVILWAAIFGIMLILARQGTIIL